MRTLDDLNIMVEKMENKFELSHQAVAKTVSDFSAVVNKTNIEITELKVMVKDFITRTDKIVEAHDREIDRLKSHRNLISGAVTILSLIVLPLITYIFTTGMSHATKAQDQLATKLSELERLHVTK